MSETQIRNIVQTHQERPIVKMAPDLVVYIDGLPYLINDYIGESGTLVNFNDFVASSSGAADIDTFIPACTVNISVPGDMKHLFQAPAGHRVLRAMSEIKIFSKGYYLSAEGNSVYHRVFWGVISNVNHSDNRKTLEITLSCKGILYLFDLMQINVSPSVQNAQQNGISATAMVSRDSSLTPFGIILKTFTSPLNSNVIDQEAITGNGTGYGGGKENEALAFQRTYAAKWSTHLLDIHKSVRLFSSKVSLDPQDRRDRPSSEATKASARSESEVGKSVEMYPEHAVVDQIADSALLEQFTPDWRVGNVTLQQSVIVSRLARTKEMVDLMGWEGYQDIDGSIIIKPPLYNLDCMDTDANIDRNPFVIRPHDLVDGAETETEDEGQVRLTRMTVHGTHNVIIQDQGIPLVPHASFLDPHLVAQFGLRQEPAKAVTFVENSSYLLYAYAVSELTKVTRKYRTYSATIPMRPELRLGFTIYMPHLDYYAYLENISWNYTRGSKVTMTLLATSVRPRELFPQEQERTVKKSDGSSETVKRWVYTPLPNRIYKFTKPPTQAPEKPRPDDAMGTIPTTNPEQKLSTEQSQALARFKMNRSFVQTEPDTDVLSWRVQEDVEGLFTAPLKVNQAYCDLVSKKAMPYTDAKGYVLLRPFPWGRFISLGDALDMFTRPEGKRTGKLLPFEAKGKASVDSTTTQATADTEGRIDAFIMAGIGTPSGSVSDPTKGVLGDDKLATVLASVYDKVQDDTVCFILSYRPGNELMNRKGTDASPRTVLPSASGATVDQKAAERADAFVTGVTSNSGTGEFSQ